VQSWTCSVVVAHKTEKMWKLIIKRSSEWNNRMRDIGIYLDNKKIGEIGNGEFKEFDVPEGTHKLKAKIDWCKSETLDFKSSDNEIKKIELSGFKIPKWLMPISLITMLAYFTIPLLFNIKAPIFMLLLILPSFAYLFYYLTFSKNKYLRLKELE